MVANNLFGSFNHTLNAFALFGYCYINVLIFTLDSATNAVSIAEKNAAKTKSTINDKNSSIKIISIFFYQWFVFFHQTIFSPATIQTSDGRLFLYL